MQGPAYRSWRSYVRVSQATGYGLNIQLRHRPCKPGLHHGSVSTYWNLAYSKVVAQLCAQTRKHLQNLLGDASGRLQLALTGSFASAIA